VQAFVNTLDIENEVETLSSPAALEVALAEIGVPVDGARLSDSDLATALAAREALRALALANSGLPLDPRHRETLERVAEAARLTIRFEDSRAQLAPQAHGLEGALGQIVAVVHEAITDGTWWRLKGCPRDVCHWVFYDRSRNGSGKWCAMSVCGNRVNTTSYRRRASRR
jgi:predicted RNA-binding Zn ribbon-like protein